MYAVGGPDKLPETAKFQEPDDQPYPAPGQERDDEVRGQHLGLQPAHSFRGLHEGRQGGRGRTRRIRLAPVAQGTARYPRAVRRLALRAAGLPRRLGLGQSLSPLQTPPPPPCGHPDRWRHRQFFATVPHGRISGNLFPLKVSLRPKSRKFWRFCHL